jgi:hypothetical protein
MSTLKTVAVLLTFGLLAVAVGRAAQDGKPDLDAARKETAEKLKEIALSMQDGADKNDGRLPPPALTSKDGKPLLSWRVAILPYLGEKQLYMQFKLDEPWDGPNNKKLLEKMPKVFAPAAGKPKEPYSTYYQVFVGPGACFVPGKQLRFPAGIPDGTSNTIMLAEAAEAVPWTKPADLPYDPKKPLPKLGGHFPDGFHVALWDGSVNFFKKDFDPQEMRRAIMPADGEIVDFKKLEP